MCFRIQKRYGRAAFGSAYAYERFSAGLQAAQGWVDAYSERTLDGDTQIDHVVPLKWAWDHGASGWSRRKRRRFAGDLLNLAVTTASTNESKGAKGLDEWMPEDAMRAGAYTKRWALLCDRYGLPFPNAPLRGDAMGR